MADQVKVVRVGIADLNMAAAPDLLRTAGLGSCVGVVLYDLAKGLAGMAHIMLPDSRLARGLGASTGKYADTAVPELLKLLIREGASRHGIQAKIAGGAQMFQFTGGSDLMRIGPRNVEAVKECLHCLDIKLSAEDTGGSSGRTIEFYPETGRLHIRSVNKTLLII
ncbi:chemotaxis protein CheD [Peribacillus sp. SCS-37]|uniref:chemotaxis protein CheD n=1 Tax=Paraperibacillus esterisolvens TaxID=3115296 RepID=UPI003905AB92